MVSKMLQWLVLILCFSVVSIETKCYFPNIYGSFKQPSKTPYPPCICTNMTNADFMQPLACNTVLHQPYFFYLNPNPTFYIRKSTVTVLQSVTVNIPAYSSPLENFTIIDCGLEVIGDNAFVKVPSVRVLDFTSNVIDRINSKQFSNLTKLEVLILRNNRIETIPRDMFSQLTSLKEIDLSKNVIKTIESQAFQNLVNLTELQLQGNMLSKLHADLCSGTGRYLLLNLSLNYLENIDNYFNEVGHLDTLDLSNNKISEIPPGFLVSHNKFSRLYIHNNELETLPERIFENFKNIDVLDFHSNKIRELHELPSVKHLDLSQNKIERFVSILTVPDSLVSLNVSGNALSMISRHSFENQINLKSLDLSHNRIDTLERGSFSQHLNLSLFDISHNKLTKIHPDTFQNTGHLLRFKASHNNIIDFDENTFDFTTALKEADLSSNKIKKLEFRTFRKQNCLTDIKIRNNEITDLDSRIFQNLQNLTTLDISQNHISDIQSGLFHDLSSLQNLNSSYNNLQNLHVGSFSGLNSLSNLDISHNQLSTIATGLFSPLVKLKTLNLSYNHFSELTLTTTSTLRYVQVLDLDGNDFRSLDLDVLGPMSLRYLSLYDNPWRSCHELSKTLSTLHVFNINFKFKISQNYHTKNVHGITCLDDSKTVENSDTENDSIVANLEAIKIGIFIIVVLLIGPYLYACYSLYLGRKKKTELSNGYSQSQLLATAYMED